MNYVKDWKLPPYNNATIYPQGLQEVRSCAIALEEKIISAEDCAETET